MSQDAKQKQPVPKGLARYMENRSTWATPERCKLAQEERAKGTLAPALREMLMQLPGDPVPDSRSLQKYCQRKGWATPVADKRVGPHADDRGLWKTDERIELLKARRAQGVRLEDIRQEMDKLPGTRMPTIMTLRRYCVDARITMQRESSRDEPGWVDPAIPDKPPPESRKCLRCGGKFKPTYFGQWLHPNCKAVVNQYDDSAHAARARGI